MKSIEIIAEMIEEKESELIRHRNLLETSANDHLTAFHGKHIEVLNEDISQLRKLRESLIMGCG